MQRPLCAMDSIGRRNTLIFSQRWSVDGFAKEWFAEGRFYNGEDGDDLLTDWTEPKRIKGWLFIGAKEAAGNVPSTKEEWLSSFNAIYTGQPIACIEIDCPEGDGLK